MTTRLLIGDCRAILPTLSAESVHCVVTSPPYFGLRDYGTGTWDGGDDGCDHVAGQARNDITPERLAERALQYGTGQGSGSAVSSIQFRSNCGKCGATRTDRQIGLEPTPDAYVAEMVAVFREVRRVLRPDGTLWLNLGDSYASGNRATYRSGASDNKGQLVQNDMPRPRDPEGIKPKDLLGIPWRVAFALQADGWWLRQDLIWHKPNPMPESVTDRCTKAHEYMFLLTKSARYHFDAEAIAEAGTGRSAGNNGHVKGAGIDDPFFRTREGFASVADKEWMTRNRRSVWTIATQPFSQAHFATFPPDLVEPCIKAGTSERGCCGKCGAPWVRHVERECETTTEKRKRLGYSDKRGVGGTLVRQNLDYAGGHGTNSRTVTASGFAPSCQCGAGTVPCTVLDPFGGAGTVGLVADRLGRDSIMIELKPAYAAMATNRITDDAPLFAEVL